MISGTILVMLFFRDWLEKLNTEWVIWIILTLSCIILLEFWRRNRNLPPGPWGLPFFGYYSFLWGPRPYIKLDTLSLKYGDVMSFRTLGGHLVIMLSRLPVAKEVFVSRADEFIGRPNKFNLVDWVDYGLGIAQSEGPTWKEHKRFFLQTAKTFGFGKMECEPLIHELVQCLVDDIRALNAKSFEPSLHIYHVSLNVISSFLFVKRFAKDDPKFLKFVRGYQELVSYFIDSTFFIVGPLFQALLKFSPNGRNAVKTRDTLRTMVKDIVEEHVATYDEGHLRDFVDSFLCQMKKDTEEGNARDTTFTKERLLSICFDMFLEGTDSVGYAICGLLLELSRHHNAQRKAQEELDSVIGRTRLPSWEDKKNLPYTEALILELFRTNQPFFTSPLYSNFEDTTLRNYRIPKRSIIVNNFWSINHDPAVFPNPSKFDPNRFLLSNKKRNKAEVPATFGLGKRSCVGESLAQMEVFICVAAMLQNFTLCRDVFQEGWIKALPREKT